MVFIWSFGISIFENLGFCATKKRVAQGVFGRDMEEFFYVWLDGESIKILEKYN